MREHKYRAWDKQQQCMIAVSNLHFGDDGSGRTITLQYKSPDGYTKFLVMGENAELMQYTGLKDREGIEIYEGDIVRSHRHNFDLIVKWCDGKRENLGNCVGWVLHDGYYTVEFTAYLAAHEIKDKEEYLNASVLGNIYEHSELLKTVGTFGYDPITGVQP